MTGYRLSQREQQLANREKVEDESKCKFCGKKGHGSSPNFELKREKCPAFDRKCNTCGKVGHFSKTKACKQGVGKVEEIVVQHEKTYGEGGHKRTDKSLDLLKLEVQKMEWPVNKPIPHMLDVGEPWWRLCRESIPL